MVPHVFGYLEVSQIIHWMRELLEEYAISLFLQWENLFETFKLVVVVVYSKKWPQNK